MEIVKDAAKEVINQIPVKYRKPLVLIIGGALISTWALAKLDERVHSIIKPMKESRDKEISGIHTTLKSMDDKLNILIERN